MSNLTPQTDIMANGQALLENLGEQLFPLLDMTDQKTSDFYWTFVAMQSASILAALKQAEIAGALKLVYPKIA